VVTVKTYEDYVFCRIEQGSSFWRSWQHIRCSNLPSRKVKLPAVITAWIKLCPPYHGRKLGLKCLEIPLFNFVHYIYVLHCYKRACFGLQAPCVLYIEQAFRYSPENAFYIFNQQIYFIIW